MVNLEWDEILPVHILKKWTVFNFQINSLKPLSIKRYLNASHTDKFEIHRFSDTSLQSYAPVFHLKIESDSGKVSLITAKTRVALKKPISLPKLELCAALLLAELMYAIKKLLDINKNIFMD